MVHARTLSCRHRLKSVLELASVCPRTAAAYAAGRAHIYIVVVHGPVHTYASTVDAPVHVRTHASRGGAHVRHSSLCLSRASCPLDTHDAHRAISIGCSSGMIYNKSFLRSKLRHSRSCCAKTRQKMCRQQEGWTAGDHDIGTTARLFHAAYACACTSRARASCSLGTTVPATGCGRACMALERRR